MRADFVYIYLKPRAQAALDLALYFLFFIPGILGLIYAGYGYAADSWRIGEHSTVTAEGPPIYHFKTVIPIAGALVMLQGLAEIVRCIVCLRTGAWPARLEDVEEIDVIDTQLAHSQYVDEESRRAAMERRTPSTRRRAIAASMDMARRKEKKAMSDPALGLTMLGLIVVAIMMGFPTAFTLMGLGMIFGFIAFWIPAQHWYDNRVFDLIVQRTYGVMTNDTLLSVPLFVFMGYIMERAALVDRMFHSVQLAFRRVPASLAVTTLLVCAFWGIASGIVGAVVVLMGVIAHAADAECGLRRAARLRGDHRGRHARHPHPAVGDAHRLRGGGRAVDRQALRGGDAAGLLPHVPLPRLHPRLGDHQSEDRAQAAARPVPGRGAGVAARARARASSSVVPGAHRRCVRPAARGAPGLTARSLRPHRGQRARARGAGDADGRTPRRHLVVRGRLQRARRRWRRRPLRRQCRGAPPADADASATAEEQPPALERAASAGKRARSRRSSERPEIRDASEPSAGRATRRPRR